MAASFDLIVLGAGVVGCSVAWHAARLGAKRVLVLERKGIAEGTSSQSSGILRTHYSVPENVELARRSYAAFAGFRDYLGDADADCGLVACGYLVVGDAARSEAIRASLAQQRAMGVDAVEIDAAQARALLPLLRTDDLATFGYERDAGHADPYLTATAFARAARRLGVAFHVGETAT
ncbi:MAG: FAD-binding oxidoreductase, partial [Burkholderiales bacterium]|nr:FAD-binding oxidoreductase [Burkholderiales bacterium]